jgi:transcriptional regulator with XRE-family HTH domain
MAETFAEFFHGTRIATGLTLRQFCIHHGLDPGNISKLERGILPPPESREKLEQYAQCLGLRPGTDDWYEFFDLAAAERGKFPEDLVRDHEIVKKLPVLFRTMRGHAVGEKTLHELVEVIRKSHRAE